MLRVRLICTGKLKESFYAEACDEYAKRLERYCTLERTELPETGDPARDGEAILRKLTPDTFVAALCIEGKSFSSEELAALLSDCANRGRSRVAFVIGGSLGLSKEVLLRADEHWSYSRLTFPHMLMRVIALEQLYRSFKIISGEPYHK